MLRVLLTIGIGLPILGGLFAWYGFKERDIARASSEAPETISLSKLVARGPEGNANVILTDYVPLRYHVVKRGKRGRWDGAWVPVVPKDAGPPDGGSPKAVKALVFSDKGSNPEEVYQRLTNPQLPGLVTNRIMTPSDGVKEQFQEQYPQTDFSTCLFIHEGREPASEAKSALMIYGGIAAVVIGLGSLGLALFLWRKRKAEEARPSKRRKKGRFADEEEDEDDRPRKRRASARDDEDDEPPRKRRAADDGDDLPRRKRPRASRDDEDDDRPRRRPRRDRDD